MHPTDWRQRGYLRQAGLNECLLLPEFRSDGRLVLAWNLSGSGTRVCKMQGPCLHERNLQNRSRTCSSVAVPARLAASAERRKGEGGGMAGSSDPKKFCWVYFFMMECSAGSILVAGLPFCERHDIEAALHCVVKSWLARLDTCTEESSCAVPWQ